MRHRTRTRNAGRRLLGPGGGPIFLDTFSGADGTDLTAHRPEVGPAWAALTAGSVFRLTGSQAALATSAPGAQDVIAVDVGRADVAIALVTTAAADSGLVFRAADANNYWMITLGADAAKLWEHVSGGFNQVVGVAVSTAGAVAVAVVVKGATVTLSLGGAPVFAYTTMASLLTATKVGLRSNADMAARFDAFAVRAA